MKPTINLIYEIKGDIDRGVEVKTIGPMLSSIGELMSESNRIVNPCSKDIVVVVKPFAKGSFLVELAFHAEQAMERLMDYASNEGQQITELLASLGAVIGYDMNLINVIKFIRGRVFTVKPCGESKYEYSTEENSVTVPGQVHTLYQNSKVQNNIQNIYVAPFESGNIEQIASYKKDQKKDKVTVSKDDIDAFKSYCSGVSIEPEGDEETRNEGTVFLKPTKGSYRGDDKAKAYYFQRDKDNIIPVTISDSKFLEKLRSGDVRFHYSDTLKVRLLEKQRVIKGKITSTYDILRVIEYKPPDTQLSFPEAV